MCNYSILMGSILLACASGAFAEDENNQDSHDPAVPASRLAATAAASGPTAAENLSRSYQPWLAQIKTPYAYQLGSYNGKGVLVGVVDSGADANNPSLRGQVVQGYNALTNKAGLGSNIADQIGHGSHVSGIIAGTLAKGGLLEGVAPGAQLAMAKVFGSTGSTSSATIDAGINWLVNTAKAPIISMSLGGPTAANLASLQNGVAKGTLFTIATGNDGARSPSWPAAYASANWAKGQIIAVGAVDGNNRLASFSNWCGSAAANCVVAPGVNIASTYMAAANGAPQYAYMSGTSMATPMVAGQAALIKSQWNFLSATTIAQVIFKSATHLCSNGLTGTACSSRTTPDAQYGWGLINVSASMQPIGGLTALTVKGTTASTSTASLVSGTTGSSAALKSLSTVVIDSFGRGFDMNLGVATASTASLPVRPYELFSGFDRHLSLIEESRGGERLALAYSTPASLAVMDPLAPVPAQVHMAYSRRLADGATVGFGMGGMSRHFFGLEASGLTPLSLSQEGGRFNSPYFGLMRDGSHAGYAVSLDGGTTVRLGTLSKMPAVALQPGLTGLWGDNMRRSLAVFEVQKKFGADMLVASAGVLQESGTVLGSYGTGALGLRANPTTTFVTLAGAKWLDDNLYLAGMVSFGRTSAYANSSPEASFIDGAGASSTLSWSLGVSRREWLRPGDALGLTVSMPTRTIAGQIQATTAASQSQLDGSLAYATQAYSLKPNATERDVELAYAAPVGRLSKFSAAYMLRFNPGHDNTMPTDRVAGLRFTQRF